MHGAGAESDFSEAQQISDMVRVDVGCCGFVVSGQWVPGQSGELLGYVLNLHAGNFQVPKRKVDAFHHVLRDVIAHTFVVSALSGLTASMSLVLGPVVRLWTRRLLSGHPTSNFVGQPFPVICRYPR